MHTGLLGLALWAQESYLRGGCPLPKRWSHATLTVVPRYLRGGCTLLEGWSHADNEQGSLVKAKVATLSIYVESRMIYKNELNKKTDIFNGGT